MQPEQGSVEEKRLESLLFGYALPAEAANAGERPSPQIDLLSDLFYIDTAPRQDLTIQSTGQAIEETLEAPAWNDEEEENLQKEIPAWAKTSQGPKGNQPHLQSSLRPLQPQRP